MADLLCVMFSCVFFRFPKLCLESGVVLDCIDFSDLCLSSLLLKVLLFQMFGIKEAIL